MILRYHCRGCGVSVCGDDFAWCAGCKATAAAKPIYVVAALARRPQRAGSYLPRHDIDALIEAYARRAEARLPLFDGPRR